MKMKRKNLTTLALNKKIVASFEVNKLNGGAINSGPCTSSMNDHACILKCFTMEAC